jgi:AraC family transcriptional regulator
VSLAPPRFEQRAAFLVAGLDARFGAGGAGSASTLWRRFAPYIGRVPGQATSAAYGVCHDADSSSIGYLCGVEVTDFARLPAELTGMRIPRLRYAVFTHAGHVSGIAATWRAIIDRMATPGALIEAPGFELYDERFDPTSGRGVVEIWVPMLRA